MSEMICDRLNLEVEWQGGAPAFRLVLHSAGLVLYCDDWIISLHCKSSRHVVVAEERLPFLRFSRPWKVELPQIQCNATARNAAPSPGCGSPHLASAANVHKS